jgi:sirohydrochlorin ferrochelatase
MKHLLIVAHGSRRQASNDEVRQLADKIRLKTDNQFDDVSCAFLELAEPSIPEGIELCVENGASNVTVMPYFLSAGRHVVTDIPEEIEKANIDREKIKVSIAPYLGSIESIADLMIEKASQFVNSNT